MGVNYTNLIKTKANFCEQQNLAKWIENMAFGGKLEKIWAK
jgi:hypothetical protein